MFYRRSLFLTLSILLLSTACNKKTQQEAPARYTVVRFENLSGDPSLDWAGRAASEFLSVSLAGAMDGAVLDTLALNRQAGALGPRPPVAPGLSTERAEALLAGATRLISGYLTSSVTAGSGKVRITAVIENLTNGKIVRTVSAEGGSPFAAMQSLSREISASAKPYVSSNAEAVRLYATALDTDASHLEQREEALRSAIAADPNFGPARLAIVQTHLFKGDTAGAEAAITEARAGKLDPHTAAALDAQSAQLHDDKTGLIEAEHKLFALSPGDLALLRGLAEREMAAGQFAQAAADWKKLADNLPGDPGALNSLAYARSFAGDTTGALQALEAYGKLRPNDANVQDSMGDVNYTARRYREAAALYGQSYTKDPQFLHGGDLYKAAWAKFRAGDKNGADASFAQFKAARLKLNEQSMPIVEADWLYRTGRPREANALLRDFVASHENSTPENSAPENGTPAVRAAAAQLAIWDLIAGDRAAAATEALKAGAPNSLPMAIVRFSVLPSASAEEWKTRAMKMMAGPGAAPLQRNALAYALLLDGKANDALPLWQDIVKNSAATDLFPQAIVAGIEGKKPVRQIIPDPNSVNQFAALLEKLNVD